MTGCPVVTFQTTVDWQETHCMLRADFRPETFADQVRCDIQFGNLMRSTQEETSVEKAQFEICAHKWIDVNSSTNGLSILNDCKYGHRVKNGLISLNLLRSPVYPDPTADRGIQQFTYAVYPYRGRFEDHETIEYAEALNHPLILAHGVDSSSHVSVDAKNIIIETIKRSEDGSGTILRLYECHGIITQAAVQCRIPYTECLETNMLETVIAPVQLAKLSFTAFEVKTILLKS